MEIGGNAEGISGRIVRSLSGFYEVAANSGEMVTAKPLGLFRKEGISPLVGDFVEMVPCDSVSFEAVITKIWTRKNRLLRPPVANIDICLIIASVKSPAPNFKFLDLLCVQAEYLKMPIIIFVNKTDLDTMDDAGFKEHLASMDCPVIFGSVKNNVGMKELREKLEGKFCVMAGASGVGKSSLLNALHVSGEIIPQMAVGGLSEKNDRGKHTTRHCEAIGLGGNTFICDTPGFSDLRLPEMDAFELMRCFCEIDNITKITPCRFADCRHINEPACRVKEAVEAGRLPVSRYRSYVDIATELR